MEDKTQKYKRILKEAAAVLENEQNLISVMATLSGILKNEFPNFYWVGFYIEDKGVLKVGPYQGTLGCLTIHPERGVCGRAYRLAETQIVDDVHQDPLHIACDPKSNSEIVVPVKVGDKVIAVLDVDSDQYANFDATDKLYLEQLVEQSFKFL